MTRKIWLLLFLIPILWNMAAAQAGKFEFKDMQRIKKVYHPRLSPDGAFVVFQVSEADTSANRWIGHLWRTDVRSGETVQITRREKGEAHPRWSPDGRFIYFLSDYQGHRNIFRISNQGGEAQLLFAHPSGISDFKFSPNGQLLYFLAKDSLSKEEKIARKKHDDAYFVDETEKPVHLWRYNLQSGDKKQLTFQDYSIREFVLSPDGQKIALVAAPTPRENDYLKREIYLLDLTRDVQKKLTHNHIAERQLTWSPDGRYIAFTSDANDRLETYHQDSIFLLDPENGTIGDLLPDFHYQVFRYFWDATGGTIFFSANTGVNTQFFRLNRRAGGVRQISQGDHVVATPHYRASANRFVYVESTPYRPYDVFISTIRKFRPRQLTHLNDWLQGYSLARYQTIHWTSPDGYRAEGLLILPAGAAQKPYPLIVQLHGGPESSYRNYFGSSWVTYPQIWAANGYAIFQPNYRGSTGYGDKVMRSIIGHYFEKDIDDIISGIDYLVQEGTADPAKMAVMGWSAGGHLTNWLVTHFQRFKAACSGAGGANWYSFYAQTDVQYIREIWHLGPPYTRQDYYMEKSPVTHVMNAKTPTLILCGKEDRRVPFPQSLEMYRGLKRMGCPVQFIAFPREGHGLRELKHQAMKMKREFQWIEKHLFNRDWEISDLK